MRYRKILSIILICTLIISFQGCINPNESEIIPIKDLIDNENKYKDEIVTVQGFLEQYDVWNDYINDNITIFELWDKNNEYSIKVYYIEGLRNVTHLEKIEVTGIMRYYHNDNINDSLFDIMINPQSFTILE